MKTHINLLMTFLMMSCAGSSLIQQTCNNPNGKYCGSYGKIVKSIVCDFNCTSDIDNIEVKILFNDIKCSEVYKYNNNTHKIYFPSDSDDCLNKALSKYGIHNYSAFYQVPSNSVIFEIEGKNITMVSC